MRIPAIPVMRIWLVLWCIGWIVVGMGEISKHSHQFISICLKMGFCAELVSILWSERMKHELTTEKGSGFYVLTYSFKCVPECALVLIN